MKQPDKMTREELINEAIRLIVNATPEQVEFALKLALEITAEVI